MAKKPATQPVPESFEFAIAELESILEAMENDQTGLEESLVKYERGTFLLQWCRGVLSEAERKIQTLTATPDGGLRIAAPSDQLEDGQQ